VRPRRTCALLDTGCTETQSWLVEGDEVGDGEVLGFGLALGLGLGERLVGLGFGLVLTVGVGVGLGLLLLPGLAAGLGLSGPGSGLLLVLGLEPGFGLRLELALCDGLPGPALCAAGFEKPDAEADRAVAPLRPAFSAEASLAAAGRVAHGLFAADADVAWAPAKNTPTRPHERTAAPVHAPSMADPERPVFTTSTSP
jgi:hypothetical protein